ncbi:hypothetical protein SmJEL517_g04768 [Synchytrium microbalum]|uniref:Vacuolar import/degradation Vid27 C-terminal domain-containing protein n=1 Tax=Synchytrium microbalum TaxID=1806994 RepID=A0A507C1U9_9FUNG|nr:uncharacterized protein SmJEL517_g04768 [Synchytrium microbalum]TPX32054.1 hypothetical protein SmJEL517_g04768 [Synchytrium microbalum]
MWALKALGSLVFSQDDGGQGTSLLQLQSGLFNKVNPLQFKNPTQCIFKEASATIQKTTMPFHYQLVISRIYEDGEQELDEIDPDRLDAEQAFLIDEKLGFRLVSRSNNHKSILWKDPGDDTGSQLLEFVIDSSINDPTIVAFESLLYQCMFELKHGSSQGDVHTYMANQKAAGGASPAHTPIKQQTPSKHTPLARFDSSASPVSSPLANKKPASRSSDLRSFLAVKSEPSSSSTPASQPKGLVGGVAPNIKSQAGPSGTSLIKILNAPLYLYHPELNQFSPTHPSVTLELVQTAPYTFYLVITDRGAPVVSQIINDTMSPTFNREAQSFVWIYTEPDTRIIYSLSIKFPDSPSETAFKDMLGKCMYETNHHEAFGKVKQDEQRYLIDAYEEDTVMEDAFAKLGVKDDEDDEEEEDEESGDNDEEEEEVEYEEDSPSTTRGGDKNSALAVGYKYDRSFVVRGNRIGVFKHTDDNRLEFSTTIDNVRDMNNKTFSPRKVMLHEQDSSMLIMKPNEEHSIFRMDLERGRIVEEWKVDDTIPVDSILPDSKFAQLTPQKTFIGINHNTIFRVDPRLSGNKRVDAETKQYVTKNDFSCAVTTGKGELAVASNKGDIRLFNKLGLRAKTQLPGYGNPIIGIDATADGKLIVGTCKNYLLLLTVVTESGESGFHKPMGSEKPTPRMLKLKPEHVAWMGVEVSFTPARFNTGEDTQEKTIVTSSGPYVITWNLKRVLKGALNEYHIKKYDDTVISDQFRHGSDDSIIVTLPENVEMINKKKLSTPQKLLRSRRSIVNSPY